MMNSVAQQLECQKYLMRAEANRMFIGKYACLP
jgi:hypothetical protein